MSDLRYRPADTVAARALDDKLMFLDFQAGELFEANGMGAQVWRLLSQQHTVGDIERALHDRYPQAAAAISRDVPSFVQELVRRGLVVPQP